MNNFKHWFDGAPFQLMEPKSEKKIETILAFVALVVVLAFLILNGCGCTRLMDKLKKTDTKGAERTRELVQGASLANQRAMTGATVLEQGLTSQSNCFANIASDTRRATEVTGNQLQRAGAIVGSPATNQTPQITALLSTNVALVAEAEARERVRMGQETAWQTEKRELEARLLEYGAKYEAERNKGILKRIWYWGVGTFGLVGFIAFIVFCPAIALPLLGRVLAWIVGAVPKLANFLGVVGSSVVTSIVSGIEKAKGAIDEKAKETLEGNLSKTMDSDHKAIVREVRAKLSK